MRVSLLLVAALGTGCEDQPPRMKKGRCVGPLGTGHLPWDQAVESALDQIRSRGIGVVETGRCTADGRRWRWLRRASFSEEAEPGVSVYEDASDGVLVASVSYDDKSSYCDDQTGTLWRGRPLPACEDVGGEGRIPQACFWGYVEICYDDDGRHDEEGTCEPWSEDLCVHLGVD